MKAYREFIVQAPTDVSGFFAFLTVPPVPLFPESLHNRKMCAVVWCSTASPAKAEVATKAMRSVGKPALDHMGSMPFPALQRLFDPLYPTGLQWYWRADFFKEISDTAIEVHLKHAEKLPTGHSTVHLYPINGTVQRVGSTDTAFSYRDCLLVPPSCFCAAIPAVIPSRARYRHTADAPYFFERGQTQIAAYVLCGYTNINMYRTIEQILGLPPSNQFDLAAEPMFTAFSPDCGSVFRRPHMVPR